MQKRDVSGPQALSCAAFLDFTTGNPDAALPLVSQIMWAYLEEPSPDTEVLDPTRGHIWYQTTLRDKSGSMTVGIPHKAACILAQCSTKEEFLKKHGKEELNMPLLCQVRVSRQIKRKEGAFQTVAYVNHQLESVEVASWNPLSAPNASYTDVLTILNNCPEHDQGVLFAYLSDSQPDPH